MFKHTTLALVMLSTLSGAVAAKSEKREIIILSDLSRSNPLLEDERFNQGARAYLMEALDTLKRGDAVVMHSFGSLNVPENFVDKRIPIKRHNHKSVKRQVGKAITSLSGIERGQGSTNLLAWFGRNQPKCGPGSQIIVLTDGIEASEYVDPNKLLSGEQSLPKPHEFVKLKGCNVVFYGLGAGRKDTEALRLRRQWRDWFASAGASFSAVLK